MLIKQISVFVENKPGRLNEVIKALVSVDVDIRALSLADTTDFGILRLIVNKPEIAATSLKSEGFMVSLTDVIAIGVPDKPGGLSYALDILTNNGIGVEYMYAFIGRDNSDAMVIFRVENITDAIKVLMDNDIRIIKSDEIYMI